MSDFVVIRPCCLGWVVSFSLCKTKEKISLRYGLWTILIYHYVNTKINICTFDFIKKTNSKFNTITWKILQSGYSHLAEFQTPVLPINSRISYGVSSWRSMNGHVTHALQINLLCCCCLNRMSVFDPRIGHSCLFVYQLSDCLSSPLLLSGTIITLLVKRTGFTKDNSSSTM